MTETHTTHSDTRDDHDVRIVVTTYTIRKIHISFASDIPIEGGNGRPGIVSGFLYHDECDADTPVDGHPDLPHVPYNFYIQPVGHLFRKDGQPTAQNNWAFTNPAKRAISAWCESHPGWWKASDE